MAFQKTVNLAQAVAIAGDFAGANPRATVIAHEGGLVAGPSGVNVGTFAWASNASVLNAGTVAPTGFIARTQGAALITTYLAEYGNLIPAGFGVTLYKGGDFYAKVTVAQASIGNKAFASQTDGSMQPGAAGATISGYVETPFYITGFPVGGTGAVNELAVISRP